MRRLPVPSDDSAHPRRCCLRQFAVVTSTLGFMLGFSLAPPLHARSRSCLQDLLPPASTSMNRPRICYMQTIGSQGSGPSTSCTGNIRRPFHVATSMCSRSTWPRSATALLLGPSHRICNTKPPCVRSARPSNSSSAGGLQFTKYYRKMDMVARSDDLMQTFRAAGCRPQQSPKRLKLRASEFRQLVHSLLHELQHPRTIVPLVLLLPLPTKLSTSVISNSVCGYNQTSPP